MALEANKWLFIVNPVAGDKFAGEYVPEVEKMIKKYNVDGEIVLTERKGHATEITSDFLIKGFNHFIAVGGDGTVNEMLHELVNKDDVTFGVVAAGTGNDFIQILGFPDRFTEQEWDIFFERNVIKIDIGKCNENYFLNGMGLGFDAQVAADNYKDDGALKEGKKSKYLWHILKNLFFYKEQEMNTIIDGQKQRTKCFINTISIGRRFAGKYFLTPKAFANDGLLDVCMIKELGLLQRFTIFLKVPKGEHIKDKNVNYYQTANISLEFEQEVPHHLDGEIFYSSHFEVSLIQEGLNIIYNPHGPHFFKLD